MTENTRIERRVSLRDLRVLVSVIESGSMGKAAKLLATSQPAISRSIADLEHAFGVRLLDRSAYGVAPTPYGHALLKRGVAIPRRGKAGAARATAGRDHALRTAERSAVQCFSPPRPPNTPLGNTSSTSSSTDSATTFSSPAPKITIARAGKSTTGPVRSAPQPRSACRMPTSRNAGRTSEVDPLLPTKGSTIRRSQRRCCSRRSAPAPA